MYPAENTLKCKYFRPEGQTDSGVCDAPESLWARPPALAAKRWKTAKGCVTNSR
jgi:hypothetical protein